MFEGLQNEYNEASEKMKTLKKEYLTLNTKSEEYQALRVGTFVIGIIAFFVFYTNSPLNSEISGFFYYVGLLVFIISAIVCIIASIKKKSMKGALDEAARKYYEQKSLCETLQAEMSAVNSQK